MSKQILYQFMTRVYKLLSAIFMINMGKSRIVEQCNTLLKVSEKVSESEIEN